LLNQSTVKDKYPLPRIDVISDYLHGAKYFSTLDLCSGYWQIEIEEKDKIKTRVGHDQVFSLYAPIPIFKKKFFSDPIIDQILDENYDQIPIIDPIKNKRHLPKKKHFLQVISFIPLCENEQHIKVYYIFLLILI
jgi:hypothetical protein